LAVEWKEVPLGELYDFSSGLSKPRSEFGFGHGFLSFKDVFYNYFTPPRLEQLVNSTEKEQQSCSIKRGDVFMTRTSETMEELGMSCVALRDYDRATFNGFTKRLRPKSGAQIIPEYAGYFFRSPSFRREVTAMSSLSTRASLNNEMLSRLTMAVPPPATQEKIGTILKSLDDKIELNRRMNATLEAMARALFRSWFVDFDPVRAKLGGRQPVGLDQATADLFPETFEETAFGHIPNGWEVKTLGEVIELAYGKPLKAEDRKHGPVCVYGANGPVGWHDEKLVSGPGIVIGRKGNPGVVTWAHGDFYPIDTTFYVEPIGACRSVYFFYHALSLQNLANLSADSAVPGLNRNHAYLSMQVIPSQPVLSAFDSQISPIYAAMHANEEQARNLGLVRDTLLPKLLSGELTVPTWSSSE
jgi:type I restriction enzyme S subunit